MTLQERTAIRTARYVLAQCQGWVKVTGTDEGRELLLPSIEDALSELRAVLDASGPGADEDDNA